MVGIVGMGLVQDNTSNESSSFSVIVLSKH